MLETQLPNIFHDCENAEKKEQFFKSGLFVILEYKINA